MKELKALDALITLQYQTLVYEKDVRNTFLNNSLSTDGHAYACCRTNMKTKEAMITFAIKPIFDRIATSPMETIFATFHVVAHELSHVLAIRKYGRDGIGHGFFWKRIMEDTFQLEGYEIHKTNQVYVQLPDIIHKKERLNDIQNLYQTWRLEEPNWKDPLIKKIIKGQYH